MYRIGWLSTGRDKAARDLLKIAQRNIVTTTLPANISFVFSNREPGESPESDLFFNLVREYCIPLWCLSSKKFNPELRRSHLAQWRLAYDREVMNLLGDFGVDLYVMAGYMLILGEEMCLKYNIINLHPALPGGPSGTWQEVIWKLIEAGATRSGATMHLVTPELDQGPPITYCTFPLRGKPFDKYWKEIEGCSSSRSVTKKEITEITEIKEREGEEYPLFKLIRLYELKREFPLIVSTLKSFSVGQISIHNRRVVNAGGEPIEGYDLTGEVGKALSKIEKEGRHYEE